VLQLAHQIDVSCLQSLNRSKSDHSSLNEMIKQPILYLTKDPKLITVATKMNSTGPMMINADQNDDGNVPNTIPRLDG
jgi:hypothetical protein